MESRNLAAEALVTFVLSSAIVPAKVRRERSARDTLHATTWCPIRLFVRRQRQPCYDPGSTINARPSDVNRTSCRVPGPTENDPDDGVSERASILTTMLTVPRVTM